MTEKNHSTSKKVTLFDKVRRLPLKIKLLILGLLLVAAWFSRSLLFGTKTTAPTYQTAKAEQGTLVVSVTGSGTVSSASNATITTSATGVVNEVYVKSGESVTKGQKIATITLDVESQQKQTAAWSSYLSAQNSLNAAKSKMNSLQSSLFKANQTFVNGKGTEDPDIDDPTYIIQKADWLQAESDYNNQAGVIRQTQAALSSAWLSYSLVSSTITAPISGTVASLSLTPGMAISGSTSSTDSTTPSSKSYGTITLAGTKPQAAVSLSEIDITKASVGQKVTITLDAFPDKTFTGKVSAIDTVGSVSSGVTSYPVTITFDSSVENMYPNMAVSATIITGVRDTVILVPSSAIQTTNGQSTVEVMKDGKVSQVTVEVGESNDTQTEIVSGIQAGDEIVTSTSTAIQSQSGTTTSPFGGTGFGGGLRR